jgi:putative membrane protein
MDEKQPEAKLSSSPVPATAEEILGKYTPKNWFKSLLFGIVLGLAIIIPGISGAAVAIIFKLYSKILYCMEHLFSRKFKPCFLFVLPILVGFVIGIPFGVLAIQKALDYIPFSMILFFAGLMIGSLPSILDESKGTPLSTKGSILRVLGFLVPLVLGAISIVVSGVYKTNVAGTTLNSGDLANQTFGTPYAWWLFVAIIPVGIVIGLTQVVPGLSATAFLMMLGWYLPILDTIHLSYWGAYPMIWVIYGLMGIGLLIGFFLASKAINKLLATNRNLTFRFISGLAIGSVFAMFLNPEVYKVYMSFAAGMDTSKIIDISLAGPLLLVGFGLSFGLVLYSRKHKSFAKE